MKHLILVASLKFGLEIVMENGNVFGEGIEAE